MSDRQTRHPKCNHGMYKDMCDICKPAPSELAPARGSADADLAIDADKMEDCLLFLRIRQLISQGDVDRIRRKMELRMAELPKAKKPSPQNDKLRDAAT